MPAEQRSEQKRGKRLIGVIGIAGRERLSFRKRILPEANRLRMKPMVERQTRGRDRGLNHDDAPPWPQHAQRLFEEAARPREMMKYVEEDDIAEGSRRERQPVCVARDVEPCRELDIARDDIRRESLEVARAAADLKRTARHACGRDAPVQILVDRAEDWLRLPDCPVTVQAPVIHVRRP
jgi:hypothetical protein